MYSYEIINHPMTGEKVSFIYWWGSGFKRGTSKVYDVREAWRPSGKRVVCKVWNNDRKTMEWVPIEACEIA